MTGSALERIKGFSCWLSTNRGHFSEIGLMIIAQLIKEGVHIQASRTIDGRPKKAEFICTWEEIEVGVISPLPKACAAIYAELGLDWKSEENDQAG